MKKKSPPYAIIGAAALGIIVVFLYLSHEKNVQAEAQAALARAKADADAALAAEKNSRPAPTVVQEQPTNMRKVWYATQPIAPGVRLSPSFFESKLTPNDILADAYPADTDVDGWFATHSIEKGDALTPRNIGKELPFMSGRIPIGMRAISLPIFNSELNSTGGFIVDGDKVDLLATTHAGDYMIKTEMVMQNLQVLYVPGTPSRTKETEGVNPAPPPGDPIAVTFEVTPEQAQALIMVSQAKDVKFSMILRARRDTSTVKIKPFNAEDYGSNLKKIQGMVDKSVIRVQDLQKQIEDEEKKQGQGNTNATPTPPSP